MQNAVCCGDLPWDQWWLTYLLCDCMRNGGELYFNVLLQDVSTLVCCDTWTKTRSYWPCADLSQDEASHQLPEGSARALRITGQSWSIIEATVGRPKHNFQIQSSSFTPFQWCMGEGGKVSQSLPPSCAMGSSHIRGGVVDCPRGSRWYT